LRKVWGVKLSGFGVFAVREKGERIGRNPKTGTVVLSSLAGRLSSAPPKC
jgi:nucleoid DNA-binding protein